LKKIVFITAPDAEYGFSLTGMAHRVAEPSGGEAALREAMAGPDNGLIIIDERVAEGVGEERLRELEQGWHGILLLLPSPELLAPEVEDYAARLIRRAIGYHVRLNV